VRQATALRPARETTRGNLSKRAHCGVFAVCAVFRTRFLRTQLSSIFHSEAPENFFKRKYIQVSSKKILFPVARDVFVTASAVLWAAKWQIDQGKGFCIGTK